jgi:hypothetical protein
MKKYIFFLLISCPILGIGQEYVPFLNENAEWNDIEVTYSEGTGHRTVSFMNYTLKGDTIINEKTYSKLRLNVGTKEVPVYSEIGFLREADKKVYYVRNNFMRYFVGSAIPKKDKRLSL